MNLLGIFGFRIILSYDIMEYQNEFFKRSININMSYSIISKIKNAISNAFSSFIYLIVTIVVFILIVIIKVYSLEKIRNPIISKVLYVLGLFFVPGIYITFLVIKEVCDGTPLFETENITWSILFFVVPLLAVVIKEIIIKFKKLI
jgi:hypothetical protein